ncbi:2-hydroxy-3-keto-5-methylthiopentenyl-1-phosphate phosphatase [compost metagenome]
MARRVLVIGDGQSDMCVASTADFVFATDRLAEHCERNNIAYARFDSFAELPALLALLPSVSAANTFKRATQEFFQHV